MINFLNPNEINTISKQKQSLATYKHVGISYIDVKLVKPIPIPKENPLLVIVDWKASDMENLGSEECQFKHQCWKEMQEKFSVNKLRITDQDSFRSIVIVSFLDLLNLALTLSSMISSKCGIL